MVVNKVDGEHHRGPAGCSAAIRLIYPREALWRPPALTQRAVRTGRVRTPSSVIARQLTGAGDLTVGAIKAGRSIWQLVRDAVLIAWSNPTVRKVRSGASVGVRWRTDP